MHHKNIELIIIKNGTKPKRQNICMYGTLILCSSRIFYYTKELRNCVHFIDNGAEIRKYPPNSKLHKIWSVFKCINTTFIPAIIPK